MTWEERLERVKIKVEEYRRQLVQEAFLQYQAQQDAVARPRWAEQDARYRREWVNDRTPL